MRSKTKEIAVRDYINTNFDGFIHDKPLYVGSCDCSAKRRIDHRKIIGNTLLCVETDQEQHKYYSKDEEVARNNDLFMQFSGKHIQIRFNPDSYKINGVNKNPMIASRLINLKNEILKQIYRIENYMNEEIFEVIYLYYDE
jgi:hypothetical protein